MRYEKIKTEAEVPLKGVRVDFETVDGSVRGVTVTDADGRFIRVVRPDSYGNAIEVLVKAKPIMKTLFRVADEEMGISKDFEERHEADEFKRSLLARDISAEVKEVEVAEDAPTTRQIEEMGILF